MDSVILWFSVKGILLKKGALYFAHAYLHRYYTELQTNNTKQLNLSMIPCNCKQSISFLYSHYKIEVKKLIGTSFIGKDLPQDVLLLQKPRWTTKTPHLHH